MLNKIELFIAPKSEVALKIKSPDDNICKFVKLATPEVVFNVVIPFNFNAEVRPFGSKPREIICPNGLFKALSRFPF